MKHKHKISVLTTNYNQKEVTAEWIDAVYKSTFKNIEIIFVDNASTDDSVAYLKKKYPKIKIVRNKSNLGYCGLNNGIPHCEGDFILFLNNDTILKKDAIQLLYSEIIKDKTIGFCALKMVNYYNRNLNESGGGAWISRSFYVGNIQEEAKSVIEIPFFGIGLVRKEALDKLPYFMDKDYFIYGEVVDFSLRLRLLGYRILFVPDAIVYHMHSKTTSDLPKLFRKDKIIYLIERNLLITFFKILELKNIFKFLPYVLVTRLITIIKDIITLHFLTAFARIRVPFWILINFSSIMKKRKEVQKIRKVPDKELLRLFTEKYLFRVWFGALIKKYRYYKHS